MAKKGKLSKAQRAEVSRKNLRKAWKARGMKATFESAEPKRRRTTRKAAEPKKARKVAPVYAEPRRAAPKRRRRRAAEPAPAFVFEPRRAAPKRRKAATRRMPANSMGYAFEPALSKEERMRNMAMGWYKKTGSVPPHLIQYLPAGYEKMAAGPALPAAPAKRRAGRPRKPTAQLKTPRKVRKPTGAPKKKAGRPRLPTAQLKHPRKTVAAKPRKTAAAKPRKRRASSALTTRGRYQRVVPTGNYKSAQTGQVIAIRRVFGKRNPAFETKHIVAGVGGLVLGVIGADLLDRFIATMAPAGTNAAITDTQAIVAIRGKANAARMATSAGGAVVGFGSAYLLRHKSPTASYALGGFGLGFGVKFLTQLVTDVIMPVVFKVEDRSKDLTANRLYPDKAAYADISTTTAPPAKTDTTKPTGQQAGVGRVRDMRRPNIYRLPAPARPVMRPAMPQQQMAGNRPMTPDFGPRATRPMARPGVMGVGCGGGSNCSCGNKCQAPFDRFQMEPPVIPQGPQFIPPQFITPPVSQSPTHDDTNAPVVQVDVTADGQITATPIGTSGPTMTRDQVQRLMANSAAKRNSPYSHIMRR